MKYYSESLRKTFDTEKECLKAEKEYDEKVAAAEAEKKALAEKRKARSKEVEDAAQAVVDAQKHYRELLTAFCKDFGAYHKTFRSEDDWSDLFDWIFKF